jgi:GntR family transcriptional regulator
MFVKTGARAELLAHERDKFLKEDWPRIVAQIKALDLDLKSLLSSSTATQGEKND